MEYVDYTTIQNREPRIGDYVSYLLSPNGRGIVIQLIELKEPRRINNTYTLNIARVLYNNIIYIIPNHFLIVRN